MIVLLITDSSGALRFSELRRRMEGVSHKMLTQTLRQLEADGLVDRRVEPTSPPSVYYSLTELGGSLVPALRALKLWAEENMALVESARTAGPGSHEVARGAGTPQSTRVRSARSDSLPRSGV